MLTERTTHLDELARRLEGQVRHLIVLRGGMGTRKRRVAAEQLAAIPDGEPFALLATGRYIGEGFDEARLNRLHPNKRDVRIYDYLDADVPVLARMYEKRLKGYRALGYLVRSTVDHDPPDNSRARSIAMRQLAVEFGHQ